MKPNLISFFIFLFDHLRHEESGLPHQCAHWFAMTGVGCGAAILGAQQEAPLIHRVVRMDLLHAAAALRRDGSVSASPFFLSPASPVLPEFRYSTPFPPRGKARGAVRIRLGLALQSGQRCMARCGQRALHGWCDYWAAVPRSFDSASLRSG